MEKLELKNIEKEFSFLKISEETKNRIPKDLKQIYKNIKENENLANQITEKKIS